MTSLIDAPAFPPLTRGAGFRFDAAGPALWRVVDQAGLVIGHLQALAGEAGVRYRAKRFHARTRSFRELGDFWSPDDAIDCLRFAR